jgi:hypothetical protein
LPLWALLVFWPLRVSPLLVLQQAWLPLSQPVLLQL